MATTYLWCLDHDGFLDNPQRGKDVYGDTPTWVLTHRDLPPFPGCDVRIGRREVADLHPDMVAAAGDKHVWVIGGGDVVEKVGQFALLAYALQR